MFNTIRPEEWIRKSVLCQSNTPQLMGIKYLGSEAVGIVTVSATAATALTFEQGATVGGAAVGTGTNPGTAGVVTVASKTMHQVVREIIVDGGGDWDAWLIGALPADVAYVSAASVFTAAADAECQVDGGYAVLADTSVYKAFVAALTFNKDSSQLHSHDSQVLHQLLQVRTKFYLSASNACKVYACDDIAGTSTEIMTCNLAASIDTDKWTPLDGAVSGEPLISVDTGRLVVKLSAGTFVDDIENELFILGKSYAYGPAADANKLMSNY